ncbi:hypothetical protein HDU97_002239 [Phlyctochytrium planicorne]|nr:hypothetical protein HDU97_002239 [Phlyctochytrium planicorne]
MKEHKPTFLQPSRNYQTEKEKEKIRSTLDIPVSEDSKEEPPRSPTKELPEELDGIFIRRYIRYMQLLFSDKKDFVENVEPQVTLMREGIQYLRLLVMDSAKLSPETWDLLMTVLIEIAMHTFGRPNKFAGIFSPPLAEEICDSLYETIFYVWVYSKTTDEGNWKKLYECFGQSVRWSQAVTQWARIVQKLTKIMSIHVYGIDLDHMKGDEIDSKTVLRIRAASIQSAKSRLSALAAFNGMSRQEERSSSLPFDSHHQASPNPASIEIVTSNGIPEDPAVYAISPMASVGTSAPLHTPFTKSGISASVPEDGIVCASPSLLSKSPIADAETALHGPPVSRRMEGLISKESKGSIASIHSLHSLDLITEKGGERLPSKAIHLNPFSVAKLNEFNNIASTLQWNMQIALYIWKNMICIVGDVTKIAHPTHPSIFADTMQCIVGVQDFLLKIRNAQPFEGVHMPYLFDFATWFIKAAELSNEFTDGKALAIGCLCRLMCRRHDQAYPETILAHFYKLLFKELTGDDIRMIQAIINNCTKLFTCCLPGSSILVPTFLKCFKKLFSGNFKDSKIPENVRQNALTVLFSLISLPNQFNTVDLPLENICLSTDLPPLPEKAGKGSSSSLLSNISGSMERLKGQRKLSTVSSTFHIFSSLSAPANESNTSVDVKEVSFIELKLQLKDTLFALLDWERDPIRHDKSPETHSMILWGIAALAFDEMLCCETPTKEIIEDCVNALLDHLTLSNLKVINAAVDGLTLLAKNRSVLTYLENSILHGVVQKLVGALTEQLLFQNGTTTKDIRVLENALDVGSSDGETGVISAGIIPASIPQPMSQPASLRLKAMKGATESLASISSNSSFPGVKALTQKLAAASSKNDNADLGDEDESESIIKDAAENVLLHIIHHIDNFPTPYGSSVLSSQIVDSSFSDDAKDDDKCLYFTFNDTTLITIAEIPGTTPSETRTRTIVRDVTGKYVWDSYLFYESLEKMKSRAERWEAFPVFTGRESNPSIFVQQETTLTPKEPNLHYGVCVNVEENPTPPQIYEKKVAFSENEMPMFQNDINVGDVDMLGELLK